MTRFFKFLSKENSIRGASLILIVTLTLSNIFGLIRDRFLTKNIDTFNLDIYYAAFRVPDLVFNFLILGAISSAFIPVFSDFLARKKEKEGFLITSELINIAVILMIICAAVLFFLMPYIIPLIVPSFDTYRMGETIKISRILMITPIFFSISYILGGVLNSYKRFFVYSLAPLFYNSSIIVGAAVFGPKYGITGVVYFVVIGAFLHFLIQLPAVIKLGYRFKAVISFKDPAIRRIIRLMIPRTIGMGASQIMLLVYTAIASALTAGSIAAFSLANNIQTVPIVILGTSFATAIFPTLAAKISENNEKQFSFYLNRALRAIGFLLIPASIIFILLRAHIVRLILGSGKFGWDDTKMTALALGFFSVSILAQGLIPLLSRAFYALKNTRTPMYIGIVSVIFSIIIAYPLAKELSVAGLALAFSIGSYFNAFILFYYLRKKYPQILDKGLISSYAKTLTISIIMGGITWGSLHILAGYVDMSRFLGVLTQAGTSFAIGAVSFFGLSYLFDHDEMRWAFTRKINDDTK